MKRLCIIVAALVLTFGSSQCKKTETPTTDEGVRITLTAGYGGEKTGFTPSTGAFVWTSDSTEYIYVGGSNHTDCLGVLSGTGNGTPIMTFSGTLTTTPDDGETLYFFYLGKGRNGSAVATLDFSNQDGTLENVTDYHIAISDGIEYTGQASFTATLNMKMAIAYFDVSGFQNASNIAETVYLHGKDVYTTATVDYQTGKITGATKGYLNMGTATNGKYVALIPSVTTETTLKFDSNSKTGTMTFLRGIQEKKYYSNNNAALSIEANAIPDGTASGIFSVSETRKVRFSHGNLQYKNGIGWRFALHQYDYIGAWNTSDYVDLYGWGTWSGTSEQWHPLTIAEVDSYYPWNGDEYFKATLDGYNDWFTFSDTEWQYLLEHSTYGMAKVGNYNGIIILPDDFNLDLTINTNHNDWTNNTYTTDYWDNNLEPVGRIVFLPAAGARQQSQVKYPDYGMYWSSTPGAKATEAKQIIFSYNSMDNISFKRSHGRAVRLVRDL